MQLIRRRMAAISSALLLMACAATGALAQSPTPWEVGMQPGFSPVKRDIIVLHDLVLVIITLITLFVAGLLAVVLYRFNAARNPVPSRVSHNTLLEVTWTVLPILILVVIAIPSFRLMFYEDRTKDPDLTLKVTAHQWYWEYTYPDQGGLDIESRYIPDEQLKPGQQRMLEVDNPLVLPVGKNIRILETSSDVIHSFFIPSLGVQRYAIPGRLIETWVRIDKPGQYYGECNQVCGTNHSLMPISIRALSPTEFAAWAKQAKAQQTSSNETVPSAAGAPGATAVQMASVRQGE